MTLILSGTDGLSDIDGSAATPAVRGTDANTGIFFGADTVGISTGGTSALSIDASQAVTLTNALPVTSGGTGVTTSTGTGAVVLGTSPSISGAVLSSMASSVITSGTAVASTSGTSIDFTSLPAWVKKITVMFSGVSTNGSSVVQLQIGAGSVTTSGYAGAVWVSSSNASMSTGFLTSSSAASGDTRFLIATLATLGSNIWVYSFSGGYGNGAYTAYGGGGLTLGGTLDQVRITTVNGTDAFDAGTVNILFE
jgi:hypothetical protein